MKKYLSILLALLALICSCQEEQPIDDGGENGPGKDPASAELFLSATKLVFSSWGGSQTVDVTTNQTGWTATAADDSKEWLSVTSGNNAFTISVTENPSATERQGSVTVSAGEKTVTLAISQEAGDAVEEDEDTSVSYTLAEGTTIAPKALAPYITSIDKNGHVFTIGKDIPEELVPSRGKLIINTPTSVLPGGLLANIQSIDRNADGGYDVHYSELEIGDVFASLDINSEGLNIAPYVTDVLDGDGNPLAYTATKAAYSKNFHIEFSQTFTFVKNENDDSPYSASINFTPKIILDLLMKFQMTAGDGELSSVNFKLDTNVSIGADLSLDASGTFNFVDPKKRIATIVVAAIPVGPLLITPKIDIYPIANVSGKISFYVSMTQTFKSSAWMHWNKLDGLSCQCTKPEMQESDTKFEEGAKLEGSLNLGLSPTAAIGVYDDLVDFGLSLDIVESNTISGSFDLAALIKGGLGGAAVGGLLSTEIAASIGIGAKTRVHLGSLEFETTGHGVSVELAKWKLFPTISEDVEAFQEGGGSYTFRTTVSDYSILSGIPGSTCGGIVLYYRDLDSDTPHVFPFDMDNSKRENLYHAPWVKQTIQATATGLEPGKKYNFSVGWQIGDFLIPLFEVPEVQAISPQNLQALQEILADIRSCASGNWEGCNWNEDKVPFTKYENLLYSFSDAGDSTWVYITLPPAWKLGSSLNVNNHSAGKGLIWQITITGANRKFNTINIQDTGCDGVYGYEVTTDNFIFRGRDPGLLLSANEKWDVSGCPGIYRLGYSAPVMIADDCPNLGQMEINVPSGKTLRSLSIKNNKIRICEMGGEGTLTSAAIAAMSTVNCNSRELIIANSDMSSISIGDGPTIVDIGGVASVSISNASHVKRITARQGISSLSVVDCPVLTDLDASRCEDLTSFSVSNLPKIHYLDVSNSPKLKCVMPSLFDSMLGDGAEGLHYSRLYDYKVKQVDAEVSPGEGWHLLKKITYNGDWICSLWYYNNGYGFYYSGEPTRGYHGRTKPDYMYWEWD